MTILFLCLLTIYLALTGTRFTAAWLFLTRTPGANPHANAFDLTILQPILSGDPALESCLAANLANTPDARFIWLIDEDDGEGRRIGAKLASDQRIDLVLGPPPSDGENPKVAKLARALPHVETPYYAVLDDDTMLPRGAAGGGVAALARGDLVTGLPLYVNRTSVWARLLCGFVNGSALITYPPGALFGAQRTINGMFYVGRTDDLRALGGFDAIRATLTDDYAMAQLYLRAGKRIVQTAIVHPISTSVRDGAHYAGIMRRWMIFAMRYVRENVSPFTLGVIGLPTFLPLMLVLVGAFVGVHALIIAAAALFLKALLMARLRAHHGGGGFHFADPLFEIMADIATPFHFLSALIAPSRFKWRSRAMRVAGERIHYE